MIRYSSVHSVINEVLNSSDLSPYASALYSDYISYMSNMNVNMNVDEKTTNRNLVIYLANFLNFLEQTGYRKITLQAMLDQSEIKERQNQMVDDFFEKFKVGNQYQVYGVTLSESTKNSYANSIKSFGLQFVRDLEPKLEITTSYSYNGGISNPTKKVGVNFSSQLSAGLINRMELNQLVQNIVFEKLDPSKVKSYGNVTELTAVCSSSSSSSSCSFIAYMKLA